MTRSLVIVAWVGLAGCSHPPDCATTVTKAADAMKIHDLVDVKALTRMCASGWSAKQRQCIADANDIGHVAACVPDLVTYEAMQAREAELAAKRAEALADLAADDATLAQMELAKVQADVEALNAKVDAAADAVVKAQNDNDRAAAKARLDALRQDKAALDVRMDAAKTAASRAQRAKGITISKECLDKPLAKDCP